jgi:HK97 gp10 family phage protein
LIEFQMKGAAELNKLLQQLPVEVETKILRNGLNAGARVIRDEARSRVHKKSGKLSRAIKTASGTDPAAGVVTAKVKLRGQHAFLGIFMEYGVLPHLIWASQGKGSLVINGVAIGKRVQHPGHAAFAFMRPALDAKAGEAVGLSATI